jgi:hypothetical protein
MPETLLRTDRLAVSLPGPDGPVRSYAMNGNGGNSVQILPDHDAVIVITTTNFNVRQPHMVTLRLVMERILPALQDR